MSTQPLMLDFQAIPNRGGWAGITLLAAGVALLAVVGWRFYEVSGQRAGLELRLGAEQAAREAGSAHLAGAQAAAPVMGVLGAPWGLLLQELEAASHDESGSVAVLAVEPDREKGRIRILAESRDLKLTLAYLERLQKSRVLRYPTLDSHEIRTEDKDQPVRFQLSADWTVDR